MRNAGCANVATLPAWAAHQHIQETEDATRRAPRHNRTRPRHTAWPCKRAEGRHDPSRGPANGAPSSKTAARPEGAA
eukprot:11418121-Alexandrium_andersonii.AAC.1